MKLQASIVLLGLAFVIAGSLTTSAALGRETESQMTSKPGHDTIQNGGVETIDSRNDC